jgi:hypothetical protein
MLNGRAMEATPVEYLLARLDAMGVPFGREDSFKLGRQRLIGGRVLIGVEASELDTGRALALASELGMPDPCLPLLRERVTDANAVFFGFEDLGSSWVCKVYLEFWDAVRRETLRTGAQAPQLLHLGVKWDTASPGHHEVARYDCHPLLNVRTILRRMVACYGSPGAPQLCELTQAIVRNAAQREPGASMLYLEVSEQDNPRSSFDINLYKSGMRVGDVAPQLRQAAAWFQVPVDSIDAQLQRLGASLLGHLSSGLGRHGQPFLSVYAETTAP